MVDLVRKIINSSQLHELESFWDKIKKFGVNFAFYNTDGELSLLYENDKFKSSREQLKEYSRQALNQDNKTDYVHNTGSQVLQFNDVNLVLAVVLKSSGFNNQQPEALGTAIIDLGEMSPPYTKDAECDTEDTKPVFTKNSYLAEILGLLADQFQNRINAEEQIEMVSTELARVYEELVLLHRISTNMRVTEADSNFLQMACDSLTEIIFVEGIHSFQRMN